MPATKDTTPDRAWMEHLKRVPRELHEACSPAEGLTQRESTDRKRTAQALAALAHKLKVEKIHPKLHAGLLAGALKRKLVGLGKVATRNWPAIRGEAIKRQKELAASGVLELEAEEKAKEREALKAKRAEERAARKQATLDEREEAAEDGEDGEGPGWDEEDEDGATELPPLDPPTPKK